MIRGVIRASGLSQWVSGIGDVLFPCRCKHCGRLFARQAGAAAADDASVGSATRPLPVAWKALFCAHCRSRWTAVASPLCSCCGLVFTSRRGPDHLCGRCLERPLGFGRARAVGIYDQTLRAAIHQLKFNGKTRLAQPLGELLYEAYGRFWPPAGIDMIAPVPLHGRRLRRRGFNQAYLLVRRWPLASETELVRDLLVRTRDTAPQTGMSRQQRRRNINNAFVVKRRGQSSGRRVLLVDDVLTTGATADACARVLMQDGAAGVDVLTLARAV
mgnify:CR=1 FL=1